MVCTRCDWAMCIWERDIIEVLRTSTIRVPNFENLTCHVNKNFNFIKLATLILQPTKLKFEIPK